MAKKKGKKVKKLNAAKDFGKPVRRTPKQRQLSGMEDNAIQAIEDLAIEHSDITSEITARKVDLKSVDDKLGAVMRREGKKEYRRGSIHVKVRPGHEAVSVQVKRHAIETAEPEEAELEPSEDPRE